MFRSLNKTLVIFNLKCQNQTIYHIKKWYGETKREIYSYLLCLLCNSINCADKLLKMFLIWKPIYIIYYYQTVRISLLTFATKIVPTENIPIYHIQIQYLNVLMFKNVKTFTFYQDMEISICTKKGESEPISSAHQAFTLR